MMQLKRWQWLVLILPIGAIGVFLLVAAGQQIHSWGLNWIWGLVTLVLVGWRWLLVRWTRPLINSEVLAQITADLEAVRPVLPGAEAVEQQAEAALQVVLVQAQADRPIWEDWPSFWQRCQEVVSAVAQIYYPEVKYPLLNIHIPQAYGLIRGTVDDMDLWMQKLSPVLSQVTLGQGYEAYEVYRKLEPTARKLWQAWNWASWVLNPVAAAARQASQPYTNQANQQLLVNLGQSLRETALRNLCRQAMLLYGKAVLTPEAVALQPKTQSLREILAEAEPLATGGEKPLNILLVGRTGAGKSSLINTLFQTDLAQTDLLPNTDRIQHYQWLSEAGTITLWDTPGYEQVNQSSYRQQVLDYAHSADLLLLVTPALDPALQMDVDFLNSLASSQAASGSNSGPASGSAAVPTLAIVTQVDRLRPLREWQPPYDWQWGNRPKEVSIREAVAYRLEMLGDCCSRVLPLVTGDLKSGRESWGADRVSLALVELVAPASQFRLARLLRDLDARSLAAAKIIDRYAFQITTTRDLTVWLKSPVLALLSKRFRLLAATAPEWATQIPVEQIPTAIGKLQMAYDLFRLLKPAQSLSLEASDQAGFDLRVLGPLLLDSDSAPDRSTWALGQALVEYWTKPLAPEQLQQRYRDYLSSAA
ncbi:MAG: GTPase family protein [Elainella sp.]